MSSGILSAFTRLSRAIELAEQKISEHHCPFPVELPAGDDDFVLGWQKAKGRFHICILFEEDGIANWTPIADCSTADRLAALPVLSELDAAVAIRAASAEREINATLDAFEAEFFAPLTEAANHG